VPGAVILENKVDLDSGLLVVEPDANVLGDHLDVSALGEVDCGAGFDRIAVVCSTKRKEKKEEEGDMKFFQFGVASQGLFASYDELKPSFEK
jgi:hypothetical protein